MRSVEYKQRQIEVTSNLYTNKEERDGAVAIGGRHVEEAAK